MSPGGFWIGPDGKKFGAQIAGAGFVEADVANVFGIGGADVKTFVKKTLRSVGPCKSWLCGLEYRLC
jgi:hypothetical protein